MKIESIVFRSGEHMPPRYTCDGENVSPPLLISGVPKGAKSLVLICDDPDAGGPPAGGWVHWVLWNIKPDTEDIPSGGVPEGAVQGKTSFGKLGYGGPCPPDGTHRYYFKLFALNSMLNLDEKIDAGFLEDKIQEHILEKAELIGLYTKR
jgi:Raf kinase inhibitor-like YbhB/YbcL family protein